ncbi:MAG: MBOAT family protein [Oscillospiraceae bacterium]|nr:MBOAT family protein [Oscillospiraceae bacterium]
MVFSSLNFLYLFLPLALLIYYAMPSLKSKNIALTVLSLFFYSWGEPVWVVLLVISSVTDFYMGKIIGKYRNSKYAKYAMISSLAVNIGFLLVFKYSGLLVETLNAISPLDLPVPNISLPIGISFYTFQTLSYTIDVYREKAEVNRSFMDFLLFVSLFPQLIAGPILRYVDVAGQLAHREHNFEKFKIGITRFVIGLSKKIIIANHAGEIADQFLNFSKSAPSTASVWYGVIMFAIQIYFDFSGYSDMAIGLGKMLGFDYRENFDYPYTASSITNFWRRWHMSLSSFFKDYVYIPLGGNKRLQIRNIAVVWLLTGIWHGASWNFALWGVFYGIVLILEKVFILDFFKKIHFVSPVVSRIYALFIVLVGWCLFYFTDFGELATALKFMFVPEFDPQDFVLAQSIGNNAIFFLFAAMASTPLFKNALVFIKKAFKEKIPEIIDLIANLSFNGICVYICTALLTGQEYNPFLYFKF